MKSRPFMGGSSASWPNVSHPSVILRTRAIHPQAKGTAVTAEVNTQSTPEAQEDYLLSYLVQVANEAELFRFGITLCVGGLLISGHLVGANVWREALVSDFRSADPSGTGVEFLESLLDGFPAPHYDPAASPTFIHLVDAEIFPGDTRPLPGNRTVPWRGRIRAIDGWTMGVLSLANA